MQNLEVKDAILGTKRQNLKSRKTLAMASLLPR